MNVKLLKLLIVGTLMSLSSVAFASRGLVEHPEDGLVYVGVGSESNGEVFLNYSRFSCRLWCSRTSGSFRAPVDSVIHPSDSIVIESRGANYRIGQDRIVLANDGQVYQVRDVFEDGEQAYVVGVRLTYNLREENRAQAGNIDPRENVNVHILEAEDIQAVEVNCFLGICSGQRYQEVAGAPLCDFENLRNIPVRNGVVLGVPDNLSCRVDDSAPIDYVFNDGTLVNGPRVFNPFPSTIHRYYQVTESEEAAVAGEGQETLL